MSQASAYACAYAVTPAPCAAACAPFKNSPATYQTCCKQHAANAPKTVTPAQTDVIKSALPKPPSTAGMIDYVDYIPNTGTTGSFKPQPALKKNTLNKVMKSLDNVINAPPPVVVNRNLSQAGPPRGGGGSFQGVIGQNLSSIANDTQQHNGKWREEGKIPQPGPNIQIDYVVQISADRRDPNDQVTIEYDGLEHHGNNPRDGDKIRFNIGSGDVFYTHQVGENYTRTYTAHQGQPGVTPGKDAYEPLQKGKTYGLRVVKRNVGNTTEHIGYMQNLTDGGPLKEVIRVKDSGQFSGAKPQTDWVPEWRVGPRIDGKNSATDPLYSKGMTVRSI